MITSAEWLNRLAIAKADLDRAYAARPQNKRDIEALEKHVQWIKAKMLFAGTCGKRAPVYKQPVAGLRRMG